MCVGLVKLMFNDVVKQNLGINMFCGVVFGIMGVVVGSLFFLVKMRLQSFLFFLLVGMQYWYRNVLDGLSQIFRVEGVRGLYRGVGVVMIRMGFGSLVQLFMYFFVKRRLQKYFGMEEGVLLYLVSSMVSGFVVCVVMYFFGIFFCFFCRFFFCKVNVDYEI